ASGPPAAVAETAADRVDDGGHQPGWPGQRGRSRTAAHHLRLPALSAAADAGKLSRQSLAGAVPAGATATAPNAWDAKRSAKNARNARKSCIRKFDKGAVRPLDRKSTRLN